MSIPEIIPVESGRFAAWSYAPDTCTLFVRFKPSKFSKTGKLYRYENVASEQWDDAQEAKSKGTWLIAEIINRQDRHPYFLVDESDDPAPTGSPAAASTSRPVTEMPKPKTEPASLTDMDLVPEPIREVQQVPTFALVKLPEILPPDVVEGDKPFTQIMRERATAIAAAVPLAITIGSEEAFKANGAALVVIQTERRAVADALEILARPLIDSKRRLDDFRNTVLNAYQDSEKRLEGALHLFRRQAEAKAKADADRLRRENEERAIEAEKVRRKAEADRVAEETKQKKEDAQRVIDEAERTKAAQPPAEDASDSLFGHSEAAVADSVIEDAKQTIAEAEAEEQEAHALAAAPVHRDEVYTPPVVGARPDLKVSGLRKRSAKWVWELLPQFLRANVDQSGTISRAHMKDPNSISDEYWILDKKAIDGLVDSLKDRVTIPAIKAYDKNA